MSQQDAELTCVQCGSPFSFSSGEQAFFAERGFTLPKRCKPCRDAAKRQRGEGGGGGGYGGGGSSYGGGGGGGYGAERVLYDAVCAECGTETQVPFKPSGAKPVLCRACFRR